MSFSEWKMTKLSEVVDILGDGLHGTPKYTEDGDYYFINGNNLDGKIVIGKDTKRVSHDEFLKYKKDLNDRTIFVSINGTLGKVALYNGENVVLGKSACYFNVKKDVNKHYIKYVMLSNDFKLYMNTHSTGTTIKNMGLKAMREYSFALPPIAEQKSIAHILSTLDEKIEVNNQINKTLEAMAQALFKQWFIDFEFPNENGEPYKSSGGEMVESELGLIPKGWSIKSIGHYSKVKSGFAFKSEWWQESGVPVIKIKNINNKTIELTDIDYVHADKVDKAKDFKVVGGDLLIAMTGATIGKIGIVPLDDRVLLVNQRVGKFFIGDEPVNKLGFLYCLLSQNAVIDTVVSRGDGSAQPNISPSQIESIPLVYPDSKLIDKFNELTLKVFVTILKNTKENSVIVNIRDTLLPKLMSGEIRMPIEDN